MKEFNKVTIHAIVLCIGLVLMIIGFEGNGFVLQKQQEAYEELQNENNYLKFNGADVQNCPLCGSGEISLERSTIHYWITCKECYMNGSWCETVEEAINAWNSLKKADKEREE